jgi:hypothetical protein
MIITRTFSAEEVADLDLPYSSIEDKIIDRTRWGVIYDSIFKFEDEFWRMTWEDGATESQDYNSLDDEDTIIAVKVEKKEVTITKWVPVVVSDRPKTL